MNANPDSKDRFKGRVIRVFVSSTFRDMMGERDELMAHAWPELRRFCRERRVELVEVDLRWGIAEEQSTRKETLKLCLDEIRACRPFFVGLLGERYGWVPGNDAFTADLTEEQPWLKDLHGRSVTELEILHGVLDNPEMAARAFFYFRHSAYAATRGAAFQSEIADSAAKQTALKTLVKQTCIANKIPLHEDYPDPVKLAALVLEHLKAAIEAQFLIENIPDALTRKYTNETQAVQSIATHLASQYPNEPRIKPAIDAVQEIYRNNFFPEMNGSWDKYPNNVGHKDWAGCFRCHDGEHLTADGKRTIKASDCNTCHTILAQGSGEELNLLSPEGLKFKHPGDEVDGACNDCHTGGL